MRVWTLGRRTAVGAGALAAVLIGAAEAAAAPSLEIRNAAARVVVIPEARSRIAVTLIHANAQLPVRITRAGDKVIVRGDVGHQVHGCPAPAGGRVVQIRGRGPFALNDLPRLVVRTPLDVRVSVGEAVFGAVGRGASLDLANQGCGDWVIGNMRGKLKISQAGSGNARAGSAGSADLSMAGSGSISIGNIRSGLTAISSSAGDITAASVAGPLTVRVAGSGDIRAKTGRVTMMNASIAGSGNVWFGGVADSLVASVAGPGGINVNQVSGPVTRRIFGSGAIRVGK